MARSNAPFGSTKWRDDTAPITSWEGYDGIHYIAVPLHKWKQSVKHSFFESCANIAVGYTIQTLALLVVSHLGGFPLSLAGSVLWGIPMTVVSLARSFILRRIFEAWRVK